MAKYSGLRRNYRIAKRSERRDATHQWNSPDGEWNTLCVWNIAKAIWNILLSQNVSGLRRNYRIAKRRGRIYAYRDITRKQRRREAVLSKYLWIYCIVTESCRDLPPTLRYTTRWSPLLQSRRVSLCITIALLLICGTHKCVPYASQTTTDKRSLQLQRSSEILNFEFTILNFMNA